MEPWGGFRGALDSGVYAEYMPSLWLCGGFGRLCPALPNPGIQDIYATVRIPARFRADGGRGQGRTTRLPFSGGHGRGEQASAIWSRSGSRHISLNYNSMLTCVHNDVCARK